MQGIHKLLHEFRKLIEDEYGGDDLLKNEIIDYHGCLKQYLENEPSKMFIDDISNYRFDIDYSPSEDKHIYYELGKLNICLYDGLPEDIRDLDFRYEITFTCDVRDWGYCDCDPSDNGFDARYNCCGTGCDAHFPEISIERIVNISTYKYKGVQKDLWNYLDEWHGVTVDIEQQRKDAQKQRIQDDIDRLKKQLAEFK